jgi:hypothetical protein
MEGALIDSYRAEQLMMADRIYKKNFQSVLKMQNEGH